MYKNLFNNEDANIVSWNMKMGCHLFKAIGETLESQKYNHKPFLKAFEISQTSDMEFQETSFRTDGTMIIEREMCDCFGRCLGYDDLYIVFCPELDPYSGDDFSYK